MIQNEEPTIALFSTAYFPPISYVAAMLHSTNFLIEMHETYPKQSFRNRMKIVTANGVQSLSVPVKKTLGNHTEIADIQIIYNENWQQHHWRTLEAAYNASPFFYHYKATLKVIFEQRFSLLSELNKQILSWIFDQLKISKNIDFTSEYVKVTNDILDLRNYFSPKKTIQTSKFEPYYQVFNDRNEFIADLSILDLLFNEGPAAIQYLIKLKFVPYSG